MVQVQIFIQTVDWQVLLAGNVGSTAYWCEVSVTEGWIKQRLFTTLIPRFPHNPFLLVSTFHKSHGGKWQSQWDTFIDLSFYSSAVVSSDVLDSPSLLWFSLAFSPSPTVCPSSQVQLWETFHLVCSKERSSPFSCCYTTVCACAFWVRTVSPSISVTIMQKLDESMTLCCLALVHLFTASSSLGPIVNIGQSKIQSPVPSSFYLCLFIHRFILATY